MHTLLAPVINLGALLAILVYYLREPIRAFIHQRHHSLKDELDRVKNLLLEAQAKHEEFSSKLKAIHAEVSAMRDQARQDAIGMKQRVISDAKTLSTGILQDARLSADALFVDLRSRLYKDLTSSVVDRSEAILRDRLTGDDRVRIRQEFSKQVESVQ